MQLLKGETMSTTKKVLSTLIIIIVAASAITIAFAGWESLLLALEWLVIVVVGVPVALIILAALSGAGDMIVVSTFTNSRNWRRERR